MLCPLPIRRCHCHPHSSQSCKHSSHERIEGGKLKIILDIFPAWKRLCLRYRNSTPALLRSFRTSAWRISPYSTRTRIPPVGPAVTTEDMCSRIAATSGSIANDGAWAITLFGWDLETTLRASPSPRARITRRDVRTLVREGSVLCLMAAKNTASWNTALITVPLRGSMQVRELYRLCPLSPSLTFPSPPPTRVIPAPVLMINTPMLA